MSALEQLISRARSVTMTPQQIEAQRRSFAYGNSKIENDRITRESVDRAAEAMERDNGTRISNEQAK